MCANLGLDPKNPLPAPGPPSHSGTYRENSFLLRETFFFWQRRRKYSAKFIPKTHDSDDKSHPPFPSHPCWESADHPKPPPGETALSFSLEPRVPDHHRGLNGTNVHRPRGIAPGTKYPTSHLTSSTAPEAIPIPRGGSQDSRSKGACQAAAQDAARHMHCPQHWAARWV